MEEKLFVPYALASRLIQKGFDDECLRFYNDKEQLRPAKEEGFVPAPLYQQALDWVRENYDIHIYVKKVRSNDKYLYFVDHHLGTEHGVPVDDYYRAYAQGINKALDVLETI